MIPRKLVETFCRRFWVMLIPVVVAPALVVAFVDHGNVYESRATVWVTRLDELEQQQQPADRLATPAKGQVDILTDLLATSAFRESVAVAAGLVEANGSAADRAAAGEAAGAALGVAVLGPNLVGVTARAGSAAEAQRIGAAFIAQYQERARLDGDREVQVVVDYFQKQVASAQSDLASARTELAAYVKAHPGVEKTGTDGDYQLLVGKVDTQQKAVDRLAQSLQDAQRTAAAGATGREAVFTVQDAASLPASALPVSAAKRFGYPAAGLFLGLSIAAVYFYLSFRADPAIRSREDIDELQVAVLGYVPELKLPAMQRFTPLRWMTPMKTGYARKVAASISPIPEERRIA